MYEIIEVLIKNFIDHIKLMLKFIFYLYSDMFVDNESMTLN